jgi:hypothetical protein
MIRTVIWSWILITLVHRASGQLDVARLASEYKAADAASQGGWGATDTADSGRLGWGEGPILQNYAALWEVTEDEYWLEKIRQHFQRIMASASDPDGDGFLSWQTKRYSCAVAFAERLSNFSDARISPDNQKNKKGNVAAKCAGHTYLLEFPSAPDRFRILDRDTGRLIADKVAYKSDARLTQIEPFVFQISGKPHQGDRFLIRTIAPEPLEFTVHQGMMAYPVSLFIEAVKTRPQLQGRFGADADRFLAFIIKHIFEKNEQDWLDLGDAGGYRFQARITDRLPNRIMPHNQYAALARAWLVLKDLDGVPPLMARRASQMIRFLHDHLELDGKHDAYRWHYYDWIEYGQPGNSVYEDISHANINVGLAAEAARRSVIFTDQDLRRVANTWLKVMWNQDAAKPLMASRVDGSKPYKFEPVIFGWSQLSQWDKGVYELALKAFVTEDPRKRSQRIPTVLLSARRAGALDARR